MADKRMTEDEVVAELRDGMTIGIGGWGSRRKPMSLVRAILRSTLKRPHDRHLRRARRRPAVRGGQGAAASSYAFVSLDSTTPNPHARARAALPQRPPDGAIEDEPSTRACSCSASRPRRGGCRSCPPGSASAPTCSATTRGCGRCARPTTTARSSSPCPRCELDAALVHLNRGDERGQRPVPRPRPLLRRPHARRAPTAGFMSVERIVDTDRPRRRKARSHTLRINRMNVDGVVEAPERRALHVVRARLRARRGVPDGVHGGGEVARGVGRVQGRLARPRARPSTRRRLRAAE